MNLSIQDELLPFAEELQRYVTPVFLEELAREIGFIKRKRKFSGSDLAAICIWISQQVAVIPWFDYVVGFMQRQALYLALRA